MGKIRCKGAYANQVEVSLLPPCVQADWAGREYVACQYNKNIFHECLADERQRDVSLKMLSSLRMYVSVIRVEQ